MSDIRAMSDIAAIRRALPFKYVVTCDSEFHFGGHATPAEASRSGERPRPVCMVAQELFSGKVWRLGHDEFGSQPPFPHGDDTLIVAHYSSAEMGVFSRAGLAAAKIPSRHLHRVPRPHQRPEPWRQPDCGRSLFWHRRDRERRQEEHDCHHPARPAVVGRGMGRDPALLRIRRVAAGARTVGDVARHRPAARACVAGS